MEETKEALFNFKSNLKAVQNFILQEKLRIKESEMEKLKQQNQNYAQLNFELEEKLSTEKSQTEKLKQQSQDYVEFNYELQKELKTKKSETEELKQENQELERRITMLYNADNVSEFGQDNNSTVKQEYIKKEI